MDGSGERWIDNLRFSSLFWPPLPDDQQRKDQIAAYVEYMGQFTSEQFADDIAELIRYCYPSKEVLLFDDVLAVLVHHHPEHGHAVILPIISCIIDGTLVYDKTSSPFASFISLICPKSESEYSEQWALACGEILRILTHYNRPMYKSERQFCDTERSSGESHATTSDSADGESSHNSFKQQEKKPIRPLSPWITDILLAAPLGIKSDYFRCRRYGLNHHRFRKNKASFMVNDSPIALPNDRVVIPTNNIFALSSSETHHGFTTTPKQMKEEATRRRSPPRRGLQRRLPQKRSQRPRTGLQRRLLQRRSPPRRRLQRRLPKRRSQRPRRKSQRKEEAHKEKRQQQQEETHKESVEIYKIYIFKVLKQIYSQSR